MEKAPKNTLTADPITVRDAAQVLDVHPTHVTLLLRRGALNGLKWGSTWMVDRKSAEKYLRDQRKPKMGRPRLGGAQ